MKDFDIYHAYELVRDFHTIFEGPTFDHPDNAPFKIHELRSRLIKEEAKEWQLAKSRIDRLDALCDLMYVILGTAVTYSTPLLSHSDWRLDYSVGYEVRGITNDLDSSFPCQDMLKKSIGAASLKLVWLANKSDFDFAGAFEAVHENNMKKLWPSMDWNGWPNYVGKEVKPGLWLVKDLGGKVIKPPNHPKVDLTPYI